MSNSALLHTVPLVVIIAVFALVYLLDKKDVWKPTEYHKGDEWTHDPYLWTATSEPVAHLHADKDAKGGTASGKW
ncbi:hypothetical protein [Smaragdicoccus niigatensis]|uniref:aa3-type cytochrome oxidase subunit CtaJ n=1 Tax=Smaragdicoccus niigatensis TaxID=359359 RepID=UPI0003814180|nr:hypothetical protein [Smaragdicoccus niigatensis]